MYVYAYVLPKTRDRVLFHDSTYRTNFFVTYGGKEGVHPFDKSLLEGLPVEESDIEWLDGPACIVAAARYLELAQAYRDEHEGEDQKLDGTATSFYVDDCTLWLRGRTDLDDLEVVLIPEN
jgi:hypothetical protein